MNCTVSLQRTGKGHGFHHALDILTNLHIAGFYCGHGNTHRGIFLHLHCNKYACHQQFKFLIVMYISSSHGGVTICQINDVFIVKVDKFINKSRAPTLRTQKLEIQWNSWRIELFCYELFSLITIIYLYIAKFCFIIFDCV